MSLDFVIIGAGRAAPAGPPLRLRLRGVTGLRVVGASIFPDIPVRTINATVPALAQKAAGMILERASA